MKKIIKSKAMSAEEQTQLFKDTFMKGFTVEQQDFILNLKEDEDGCLSMEGVTEQIKNCTLFNKTETIENNTMKAKILTIGTEDLEKFLNPHLVIPPDAFEKMTEQAKELITLNKEKIKNDILSGCGNIWDENFSNQLRETKPSDIEDLATRVHAIAAMLFNHNAWNEN